MRNYLLFACLPFWAISSQAALFDRGGGLIYDDVLDITWLQDANYADTSDWFAAGTNGAMPWLNAMTWTSNLSYYDSVRDVTYDDWRLPTMSPVNGIDFQSGFSTDGTKDLGYAATTTDGSDGGWRDASGAPVSEMGHMYYVNLANLGMCDPSLPFCTEQADWGLNYTGPFINVQNNGYWTDTKFDSTSRPYSFFMNAGYQWTSGSNLHAWAVRDGDVSAVPVPVAVWLFGSGLLGLIGVARRKKS